MREVLEHCAREGIALEYLRLHDIQDLKGARLDGLKLSNCKVSSVNLSGASLTGARIEHTAFLKVVADCETKLDRAMLDDVQFEDCALNEMSMRSAACSGLRFEFTTARSLDVSEATFHGVRQVRSDLSGWRMHMAHLKFFEDAEGVTAAADLSENAKAAVRTLAATGSREAAEKFLAALESQTNA
ncbi:MAG TPA: pentapeptide repeat-containing protein [Caulobacter sp.]|nr:pentapeptide repeat-containing protein [Caulobacter sp.]